MMFSTLLLVLACGGKSPEPADVVLRGGTIHPTVDQTADQIALRDGMVIALDDDVAPLIGDSTELVDLAGGHAWAGFQDGHTHLLPGSFVLDRLLLLGVSSMDLLISKVGGYADDLPQSEPWIIGYGWFPSEMSEPPLGTALDAVSDRPALLVDNSGHTALVNSAALRAAGIDDATPDPPGGVIERDSDGHATGWLREEALSLVSEVALADYSDQDLGAAVSRTLDTWVSGGVTGVADIMASPGFDLARPWIYQDLEDRGELPLRIHYYVPIFKVEDVAAAAAFRGQYDGELVRFAGGKIWVDGSMSSLEAWTTEPYVGEPDNYGSHYFDVAELEVMIEQAESLELPLKLHVNGDAAVEAALDALEAVSDARGGLDQIHVFEHAVLLSEADRRRMAILGVVASLQPTHLLAARLGSAPEAWGERFDDAYDFGGFADAGVVMALGTDWPVWPNVDGLVDVWAASSQAGSHALTAAEAMRAHTEGVARSVGRDDLGVLTPGSAADIVVLDGDPLSVDAADLTNLEVLQVWVAGKRVK